MTTPIHRMAYLCLQATSEGQASHAHVHEIISGLRRRGWQVDLYEPSYARASRLPGTLGRIAEFTRVQVRLWRERQGVDSLYVRSHFAAFPTALWARVQRIPVVQEVNGPYEDLFISHPGTRLLSVYFKWLIRTSLRWADCVIAVTPHLQEWVIQQAGHGRTHVIPNGANTDVFKPDAKCTFDLPAPYVVFFGALTPWQGVETMVKAVGRPEWPDQVRLVIMGDGAERTRVEGMAARSDGVVYLGKLPYREVPGIVAQSLAGLSPQNNVGERASKGLFPLKVFETLACGVPIIVTDFPGQADLVRENRCGLVIPPDDPEALAKAVAYLYADAQEVKAMGLRGREVVQREHSWDKRAAATAVVLTEILGRRRKET